MKMFALLLGPAGIGLLGLYHSLMSTAATASGMGVSSSGVRQVAEAFASGDGQRAARSLHTLRVLTMALATLGAVILLVLREHVSTWVFGNPDHAGAVTVLAVGLYATVLSGSQLAILNGLRRIGDLARINMVGSSLGAVAAIVIVWSRGEAAVAHSIAASALIMMLCSSWFLRYVKGPRAGWSWQALGADVPPLLKLGLAFMFAGLVMTATLLLTRVILLDRFGLAEAGYFQAAWAIAVFNVDFVLRAMGVDFYPHLTSRIGDRSAAHRLVNEQMEIALLAGGPALIAMLAFAPLLIRMFYSADFSGATDLLRWLLLGNVLKLASWPLGFLILAHAWNRVSMATELVWACSYVTAMYFGSLYFGLNAAGYAFVAAYLIYVVVVYSVNHVGNGFRWRRATLALAIMLLIAGIAVNGVASRDVVSGYILGGLIACALGAFSIKRLWRMIDVKEALQPEKDSVPPSQ